MAVAPAAAQTRAADGPANGVEAFVRTVTLAQSDRASNFVEQAHRLGEQLAAHCSSAAPPAAFGAVQAQWRRAVSAWDALAALGAGPLLKRHSASAIDFRPLRPELLERAIASMPATEAEMERIGAAARGFQALEALLWPGPLSPHSPRCAYAEALAGEVEREARALAEGFTEQLATPASAEAAKGQFAEIFNRWLGGIDQLRWTFMRKPVEVAQSYGGPPQYPRRLSGQSTATWAARWSTLRDVAVLHQRPATAPAGMSLELLLRSRGMNALADRLVSHTARASGALAPLKAGDAPARVRTASLSLGELSAFAQKELAPALGVRLEFTDADGD